MWNDQVSRILKNVTASLSYSGTSTNDHLSTAANSLQRPIFSSLRTVDTLKLTLVLTSLHAQRSLFHNGNRQHNASHTTNKEA